MCSECVQSFRYCDNNSVFLLLKIEYKNILFTLVCFPIVVPNLFSILKIYV
jgi:hypothetical protein